MAPSTKKPCSVCGESGDGAHFGAEACRACAAFFRRSVAMNKTYSCRSNGNCVVQANVRCMCRACRFAKCLAVGMRKASVQRHRDQLGKRDSENEFHPYKSDSCPADVSMESEDYGMRILNKLNENYIQMDNVRKVIHNRDGESVFCVRQPRAIAYKEANAMHLKELNLVADWVINSYPAFDKLPSDQKKLLYRNFFLPFMILESGYYCCINDRTDIIVLPSGDYIDCARPETFYHDLEGKQLMSPQDAVRMFGPSFDIYRRNILDPMRREKVDNFEFFTLCSLVLWDHGLDGQSDDCVELARDTRESVLREILYYYRRVRRLPDPSMRLANLLVLLPALQRSVRRFQEDVEISHVFNVYSVEEGFYELVNGRLADSYFSLEVPSPSIKKEDPECVW
ncbi:unnamed protein product [Caenorhabditis auriculariae]|uniref:Uncharacterized protein n=1 Tax=Caenorhabditis auriculariae TaxID=2777116 RepID=A0A8S1GQI8_9PELO|nr:unnamed protein product [Caenorhabditis auriculariae]